MEGWIERDREAELRVKGGRGMDMVKEGVSRGIGRGVEVLFHLAVERIYLCKRKNNREFQLRSTPVLIRGRR